MTRAWKLRGALFCAVLVTALLPCFAQEQRGDSAAPPSSVPTPDATKDPRAQIDELLQQAYDQINVKVQFQKAAELAQQALDLSLKAGDKVRASTAMVYLSAAYGYGGRFAEAYDVTQKLVILAREAGDRRTLEQALNTAGSVAGGFGRYEESLNYFQECLSVARDSKDTTMEYMSLLNIGEAYVRSGEPERAEAPLLESLRLAGQLKTDDPKTISKSKKGMEMALLNLGSMEAERHRYRPALNYYEKVHASQPESALWVIAALEGMADAHEHLGEPQQAIELLEKAIPLAEKAASGYQSMRLVSELGVNQEMLGDLSAALASQHRALTLLRQGGGDPDYEWQIESRIGHVQRGLGENQKAFEHYQNAIHGIEQLRSVALNTEEGQAGLVTHSRAVYADTADLLYDMHRGPEALEIVERGRARAFLDMLALSRTGLADDLTPEQRKRESEILARISATQKNLWKENLSSEEEKKLKAELTSAENDLEVFHLEVRRSNPRYASVQYPEPISVSQIQNDLLDDHTALVEFLLGEKRSLVWVVKRNDLTVAVLPPRKDIEQQITGYRKLLATPASVLTLRQSQEQIDRQGESLYRSLILPIEKNITSSQTLILVPDGTLHYLPFEALVIPPGRASGGSLAYLINHFAIVYGPSASALTTARALNQQTVVPAKALVAFGDPDTAPGHNPQAPAGGSTSRSASQVAQAPKLDDYSERGFSFVRLPFTREEVLSISRLFSSSQSQVYLGEAATEDAVKTQKLTEYRYIHFATHGFIDEEKPSRSGILLSSGRNSLEDGVLQVGEIMRLKLNADLVTLSACSTGLGELVNGEGILGLTRAFFYSGARNVTVSLWNVNDSATATFMKAYYENLNRGLSKSAALQQAKLTLLRAKNISWSQPYFWAPFILVGEGK